MYPYLKEKDIKPLTKEEVGEVVKKTKALVLHKVGDVARLQTDAMIISGFINVTLSGIVDNYNLVISSVSNFVNIIFNSVLSSFGNLIATESRQKQYEIFKVYRFFACWIYGFSATGFLLLLTPLVWLWLGPSNVLPVAAVTCILIDYYFKGERIVLSNFKTAAGVFEQDKYLALIQGAVNLVISIVLVQRIGLAGVYIGTIVSGLIANITKPIIIYRVCFEIRAKDYFLDSMKFLAVLGGTFAILYGIRKVLMPQISILSFVLMFVVICVIFNGVFLLVFGRTQEFQYLWGIVRRKLIRRS